MFSARLMAWVSHPRDTDKTRRKSYECRRRATQAAHLGEDPGIKAVSRLISRQSSSQKSILRCEAGKAWHDESTAGCNPDSDIMSCAFFQLLLQACPTPSYACTDGGRVRKIVFMIRQIVVDMM